MEKRLYRSKKDRILGGVCGGIAEYFEVDPTLVRLLWVLFVLAGGAGVIAYIIAWIIMPPNPKQKGVDEDFSRAAERLGKRMERRKEREEDGKHGLLIGGIIVLGIGLVFLASNYGWFPGWWSWDKMWPVMLILVGVGLLAGWVAKRD
ncbi:PspC domain protein [Candidatus Norongarragalina meridionalis]|nr:PspC domain protein [Candidatus Norongarragalina meridionalis]